MKKMEFDLIFCIFGCDTIPKYRDEILKIEETWGKDANTYPNVKLLFFLGEMAVLHGPQYIHLPGVQNDYLSASYKQFGGLKYIHEHYKAKFVFFAGTDTYVNVPKLLKYLSLFNPAANLMIGGHGDMRTIMDKKIYFPSGGAGIVITQEFLRLFYPKLPTLLDDWTKISEIMVNPYVDYRAACDVAIAYYAQLPDMNTSIFKAEPFLFNSCTYKGRPCHVNAFPMNTILTCHNMSPADFDEFTNILHEHKFFM